MTERGRFRLHVAVALLSALVSLTAALSMSERVRLVDIFERAGDRIAALTVHDPKLVLRAARAPAGVA